MSAERSGKRSPAKARAARVEAIADRTLLRALVGAANERPLTPQEGLNWRELRFDPQALQDALAGLEKPPSAAARKKLAGFAEAFAQRFRLRISRVDDLDLPLGGDTVQVPRWLAGQALGALGETLLPTRRRARRLSHEAAREVAYFGYGQLGDQLLPNPLALVRGALAGQEALYLDPVLLDEAGPSVGRRFSIFDLLRSDEFFHREVDGEPELARFQQRLREDPLDGSMVVRLRAFFSKRATVGLRDTTRWALGSRHPWFGWSKARDLLAACFERYGTENFLCPRLNFYTYDPEVEDDRLEAMLAANEEVCAGFAQQLGARLPEPVRRGLDDDVLAHLARAALDCHHDHPDFDLEATGRQGGQTTLRFVGHAVYVVASNAAGGDPEPRRNVNLAAHFAEKGYQRLWLAGLDEEGRAAFYQALGDQIREYDEAGGLLGPDGRRLVYTRPPLVICTFYESPDPLPRAGEEVVDSFRLDELREPLHARNLHAHPEVFEKLVVFFTLVLRHYLDTDHVPDLRPANLLRDFMLLGLWGTNSPNLVINLYRDEASDRTRSEVRFVGRTQIEAYRPDERHQEAALARLMASQFGPLLEPSVLRAVGTFMMAAPELQEGSRVQDVGAIAFARHSLELLREAVRTGIKGSLVDLATMLEVLVDNSVDLAQRGLDRLADSGEQPEK